MISTENQEVRIQTSFLNRIEKKALLWMAPRVPSYVNSDHLTFFGFFGAVLSGLGYVLSNWNENFLWLASLGLVINWLGDSLDGTLARVRNAQRPTYGFFIDHSIDGLTILAICLGAGLSPYLSFSVAMLVLSGYLLMSVLTYINTYLKGEFKISYQSLGPTEFRLIIIVINTVFYFNPDGALPKYSLANTSFSNYDIVGLFLAVVLYVMYIFNFWVDKNKYAKIDPPKY